MSWTRAKWVKLQQGEQYYNILSLCIHEERRKCSSRNSGISSPALCLEGIFPVPSLVLEVSTPCYTPYCLGQGLMKLGTDERKSDNIFLRLHCVDQMKKCRWWYQNWFRRLENKKMWGPGGQLCVTLYPIKVPRPHRDSVTPSWWPDGSETIQLTPVKETNYFSKYGHSLPWFWMVHNIILCINYNPKERDCFHWVLPSKQRCWGILEGYI